MSAKLKQRRFQIETREDITSLTRFLSDLQKLREQPNSTQMWFRGQSKLEHKLRPTAGRPAEYNGNRVEFFTPTVERRLLTRFRLRTYTHVNRALNEWEAIFLARHYGLPTRILDWTASPLAALYFASTENQTEDGTLWAMARFRDQDTDWTGNDLVSSPPGNEKRRGEEGKPIPNPFPELKSNGQAKANTKAPKYVKILHPLHNNPRLIAQGGVFTYHSYPQEPLERLAGQPFKRANLDIRKLYRWKIPNTAKQDLVKVLAGLNVSQRTLFPDLDGLARGLWEMSVLYDEGPDAGGKKRSKSS
jgi:FRG domain-containing protein